MPVAFLSASLRTRRPSFSPTILFVFLIPHVFIIPELPKSIHHRSFSLSYSLHLGLLLSPSSAIVGARKEKPRMEETKGEDDATVGKEAKGG